MVHALSLADDDDSIERIRSALGKLEEITDLIFPDGVASKHEHRFRPSGVGYGQQCSCGEEVNDSEMKAAGKDPANAFRAPEVIAELTAYERMVSADGKGSI
jgi:hypothetical protein